MEVFVRMPSVASNKPESNGDVIIEHRESVEIRKVIRGYIKKYWLSITKGEQKVLISLNKKLSCRNKQMEEM